MQFQQISRLGRHAIKPGTLLPPFRSSVPARFASTVHVDQTKQNNSPDGAKKEGHEKLTQNEERKGEDHPAKQPDPQQEPERSTGIEQQGPGGATAKDRK
jgi:hypothetical protein